VGLQQVLLDKHGENVLEFGTFWIAAIVGILTVVSIAMGVVSIVYSVKQYNVAVMQYDLQVLQMCIDDTVASKLPNLCAK
jgi:hypothetical protein